MDNFIRNMINSSDDTDIQLMLYKSMITSVGNGGNNINIMDYEDENRDLKPAYPYGFNTSPPPEIDAWVLSENGNDSNVIGVVLEERPQVASGGVMLYSVGGSKIIVQPDGSIDCYTSDGKTMKINGEPISTSSGVDENRVKEIIDEKVVQSFVIDLGFMTEDDTKDYVDDALETFEGWVDAEILNAIAIMTINADRVIVDNATNLDQKVTYYDKSIDGFTSYVRAENVTVDTLITRIEGYDGTGLYTGKEAPPTLTDVTIGDYYIASEYSQLAGYVYKYTSNGWVLATEYDITQEELEALKKLHRYEHNIVDKYYTKTEVGSQITQSANAITLYVDTKDSQIDTRVTQISNTVGDIEETLEEFDESITSLSARITVAEGEIELKANQSDMTIVQTTVGELEIFKGETEATLEILPQQITSTVTTAVNNIKIGAENLIINSSTLSYSDYYFDSDT